MSISAELQRIYSSAPVNVTWYDAIVLDHSAFLAPLCYLSNSVVARTFNLYGQPVEFQPAIFSLSMPRRDDTGLVDIELSFPLTYSTMKSIELAEPNDETVSLTVTTYIDGSLEPQMTPIVLQIDNIALGTESATARAQRIDLVNRAYPRNIVRPTFYRGLWR